MRRERVQQLGQIARVRTLQTERARAALLSVKEEQARARQKLEKCKEEVERFRQQVTNTVAQLATKVKDGFEVELWIARRAYLESCLNEARIKSDQAARELTQVDERVQKALAVLSRAELREQSINSARDRAAVTVEVWQEEAAQMEVDDGWTAQTAASNNRGKGISG